MQELLTRCSGSFIPASASDFVGAGTTKDASGAHLTALHLERAVRLAQQHGKQPLKFLFNGPPGTGKSALVNYAIQLLGGNKWSTTKLNGTQVKIEKLEEIASQLHYGNIFGDYRILWIDEADEIPRVAQVRFLTLLDDLPPATAVFCTSNCKLTDFESRFQTRFQAFNILPPTQQEICTLLTRFVSEADARQISLFACGNVRAALLDAQGAVQAAA